MDPPKLESNIRLSISVTLFNPMAKKKAIENILLASIKDRIVINIRAIRLSKLETYGSSFVGMNRVKVKDKKAFYRMVLLLFRYSFRFVSIILIRNCKKKKRKYEIIIKYIISDIR